MTPVKLNIRFVAKPFIGALTRLMVKVIHLRFGSGMVPIHFPTASRGHVPVFLVDVKTIDTPEGVKLFLRCKEAAALSTKMRRFYTLDYQKIKNEKGLYFYDAQSPGSDDSGLLIPGDQRRSGSSDPWGVTGIRRFDPGPSMDNPRDEAGGRDDHGPGE